MVFTFEPLLAAPFWLLGSPVTWLEVIGFTLALAMVVANMKVWAVAWPLAMASSFAYHVLFMHSHLYGEGMLQIFFIVIAIWGWWQWKFGHIDEHRRLKVRWMRTPERWKLTALTLAAWPLVGLLLDRVTDSDVPYFDAAPTVASVAGQWLLGRQYVENWPVWIGVNVVSVALFAYKGLWLTVLLYALFAALAVVGWRVWIGRAVQ
jgi:nicotinamide mononucleotide transporter